MSIYTPTYQRPRLLAQCLQSVEEQTVRYVDGLAEIQHMIVRDEVGVGIAGMFAEIPNHLEELVGEYVYVLQDDDVLARPDVVERLRGFVEERRAPDRGSGASKGAETQGPAVVMVKVFKRGGIYPSYWGQRPKWAHVDLGNYVVRRDVFVEHVHEFGARYEGDFDFIDTLWRRGVPFAWCDVLFACALAVGMGRPEVELEVVKPPEWAVGRRMRPGKIATASTRGGASSLRSSQ